MKSKGLVIHLRRVLREMDQRASSLAERPTVYLVGAGTLVLEGITDRATQDLDFLTDGPEDVFVNVVTSEGVHSHRVPIGLVSMPRGWRDRANPLPGFRARHARFLVPSLADRLVDKLSRGSATDWDDITAIVRSSKCPDVEVVRALAASVLADPPSSVFSAESFRKHYERLSGLFLAIRGWSPSPL